MPFRFCTPHKVKPHLILDEAFFLYVSFYLDEYYTNGLDLFYKKVSNTNYTVFDKKITGILIQNSLKGSSIQSAIIGIGLNVESTPEQRAKVDQPWTDLTSRLAHTPDRNEVIANITKGLVDVCEAFASGEGIAKYHAQWQAFDVLFNQPVTVYMGNRQQSGIARGIDMNGALRLETEQGIELLHGGEISVRKQ